MGWFVSPKILLLIVCVYDAWVFSQHQCPSDQMFCRVTQACTTQVKCDAAILEKYPTGMPTREPPSHCPQDQMFCRATHGCTTQAECDAAILEKYPTGMPTQETPPPCPTDQMFCRVTKACTTKVKCDAAILEKYPTGMPTRETPPPCPTDQMFCRATHRCTTEAKCDAAFSKMFPTGMPTREPLPECPRDQMFCRAIHNCTTQDVCDVESAKLERKKKECEAKGQIFCRPLHNCSTGRECWEEHEREEDGFECDEGQKRCNRECIAMDVECDCGEGKGYCVSKERCMLKDKLNDRFDCPPVCDVEGERYCPFSERCIGEDELCGCPKDKPVACAPLKECISANDSCPCPENHTFCASTWGCLPAGVECPTCGRGQKYCAFKGGCIPRDVGCGCEAGTKFCPFRHRADMPACVNVTTRKDACECPDSQKPCLTQMRCIDREAECACPEGQEYCPRGGECAEEGCPKLECPEDMKLCRTARDMECIGMNEKCHCEEGKTYCDSVERCLPMEHLIAGQCPPECDDGEQYCLSSGDCVDEGRMKELCPRNKTEMFCDKGKMFCRAIHGCTTQAECDAAFLKKHPTGMPTRETPPPCPTDQRYCPSSGECVDEATMKESCPRIGTKMPVSCGKGEKSCPTSTGMTCVAEDEDCSLPCRKEDPNCGPSPRPSGPVASTRPPRNKNDYFFAGTISANVAEAFNRGHTLGEVLKRLRFKEAPVEGTLRNGRGRWQVMKSTVGTKIKARWIDVNKGSKISPRDSIRFMPANSSVHGFEGIELKINDDSKYIGIIVFPCVVPKLEIKKELSGEEEKPLNFNLDDVFTVTREQAKAMASNLDDKYKEFVPQIVLNQYREMLKGRSSGANLGIMVKSTGRHRLMEQSEKSAEEDESPNERRPSIMLAIPKIFAAGSQLVFKPAKDVSGVVKVMVYPVAVPPDTKVKDVINTCGVGQGVELIINISNVNDKPSPHPIDPKNPYRLRLVVEAPPLPFELANDAANKGFPVESFAKKAGMDVDGDVLGIAIAKAGVSRIGQWQYLDDSNAWQNIERTVNISTRGSIDGDKAELLFLKPVQKIRLRPSPLDKVWRKFEALQTVLRFLLWDQSDGLASGAHVVAVKGNNAISSQVLSVFMERLGCDGRPSSGLIHNECGQCGTRSCKKCDGSTNSSAIVNECKECVLGNTGKDRDHGKDCRGICGGSFINLERCNNTCVSRGKKVTDCSGTCFGNKRINRCEVCSNDRKAGADACGKCGGDNSTCTGCDGKIGSTFKVDKCSTCKDPKSPEFNKGCTNLAAIAPRTHQTGQNIVYKLDASGIAGSDASCQLRLGDASIQLQLSLDPLQLTAERIDNAGVYDLVCNIGGEEFSLVKAVTVFAQKIAVSNVEPSQVTVGQDLSEVVITGEGFLNSTEIFCIYSDVPSTTSLSKRSRRAARVPRFTKRLPALYVSPTQCKCKINTKDSRKIRISVTLDKEEREPESHVEVTVSQAAIGIKGHKLDYRAKKIYITFTSAVKRLYRCSDFFKEATVNKFKELVGDRKYSCIVRKNDQMQIHIPGAVIKDDLEVVFKADVIVASKGFSLPSGEVSVTVKAPARILPIAVITAPKKVGSCNGIKISAKNSKKTGKRGYECVWTIAIRGVDDESSLESDVAGDLAALRNLFSTNKCAHKLNKTNILEGSVYVLSLVVTNREGSSVKVSHVIERSAMDIPSVRFITNAKVFDMRNRKFAIKVRAKKPQCVDSRLVFSWSCLSHPGLVLPKSDTPTLLLKREMLECDELYEFSLNVYLGSNPSLGVLLKYNVTTQSAPLKFGISGGDQVVPSNGIIKLKARATSKVTCGGELKYLFSCVDEDDWPCLVKNKEGEFDDLPDSESPELRIKANRFESNKTYTFTLGVFKGTQNVTASVRVKISPGTPPTVQIKKPKDGVKPVVRVRIKSSRSGTTSFNCEGVVEEGYGYVDFDDKDKVTGEFSGEGMKFNQRRLRFTFKGLRSGVEYKVRCYAYHDDTPDEIGESTTTFTVESPPEGGALAVEPAEGVSSETQFSIVASEFISDSPISIDYYTKDKRDRLTLLESNSDASLELQLPAGEGDDGDIDVVAVAKNKFGETKAAAKVRSRPKQFQAEDFDDIDSKMKDLEDQGDEAGRVALAHSVLSSAKNQEGLEEEVSQLEEETSIVITSLLASKREEGSGDVGDLFALARKFKPQTEETKTALVDEVTLAVEDTVPDSVRRRSDVQGGGGESRKRRRRAIEEDTDDDDESGMSVSEIEDILATFENLIDTTVVNNNTANFLQTVDSVLINMCKGLPLGETSVALSNLGILKADMNYLDNVDTTFLNVSCSNCSMLNHSALAKFGSEIKQMYNEWNCSGDDELCNGLCIAMAQYPHDYITAVTSPIRLSDVVYVELKNPENQDHVPISSLTQPAFFHIPLHAGYSQTSGHKCMLWSESEEQWSASGCQKTQAFTRDSVVYVECNCTKLGYITVHESDDDVQFNTQTSTEGTTQAQSAPTTTATTGGMSTTKGKENHVATAELSFDLDYNTVITDSETKIQFINVVEQKLADTMEVDPSMILNVTISPGSIVVNFMLLAPEQNPSTSLNYSLTQLMLAVNKQQFTVMLNGQEYTARNGSMTYEYKTMTGVSPDEGTVTTISEEDESKLPIILGVVFGVLLIVIIIVAVLFRRHLAKQTKVSDQNIRGSTTCAQNTGYQGSVGNDMGRPVTPGNAAPVETQHSTGGPRAGSGGVRQTAELPHIE